MDVDEITAGTDPTVAAVSFYREAMNLRHEGKSPEEMQDTEDLMLLAAASSLVGIAQSLQALATVRSMN